MGLTLQYLRASNSLKILEIPRAARASRPLNLGFRCAATNFSSH